MDSPTHAGFVAVLIVATAAAGILGVVFFTQQRSLEPTPIRKLSSPAPAPAPATLSKPAVPAAPTAPQTETSLRALLQHPWWSTTIRLRELETLLGLLTSHGDGTIFFNQRGQAFWLSPQEHREPLRSLIWYDVLYCHSINGSLATGVASLSEPRKLVPIRAGLGQRLSRAQAIALLQDCLNIPDNVELSTKQQQNLKGFWDAVNTQTP